MVGIMLFAKLNDLSIGGKGSYGIAASAVERKADLPTYLRITDIFDDGTLNLSELKSVDAPNSDKYILKPNDIVFARTGGSTGRNYFYDGSDGVFVYAGFLIKFSIDPEKVNPKYVKYYCRSKQYNDWVQSFNTGSTRGNINAQTFGNMEIPLPERKQQDYLVSILEPIDEKIRNNKQVNRVYFPPEPVQEQQLHALAEAPAVHLRDLLTLGLPDHDVYLVHAAEDVGWVPAADLPRLTAQGKEEFSALLDAKIAAIRPGPYGVELVLDGVNSQLLAQYDETLANSSRAEHAMELFL